MTIIAVLFVPLCAFSQEEQSSANMFQQYEQKTVKSTVNTNDYDPYMNYMMFPYALTGFAGYGRYYGGYHGNYYNHWHNTGHTYWGPAFWENTSNQQNEVDFGETTIVPESEYSFQFGEDKK